MYLPSFHQNFHRICLVLALFCFICLESYARLPLEKFQRWGIPHIERYTPRTTNLGDTVKSIISLPNGDLAFLTEGQFVTFDGTHWSDIDELARPTHSAKIGADEILVGLVNGMALIRGTETDSYEISKITNADQYQDTPLWLSYSASARGHIFSSQGNHLAQIKPDGTVVSHKLSNWAGSVFSIGDDIFVTGGAHALLNKWDWGKETLIDVQSVFDNAVYEWISKVIKRQAGGVWLLTAENKIIGFDGENAWLWPGNAQVASKGMTVTCFAEVGYDELAIGTNKHGMLLFGRSGILVQNLSKPQGLDDTAILALGLDSQNGIWIATKRSVSRIQKSSTVLNFDERQGLPEAVDVISEFNGKLFLGTHSGIYTTNHYATESGQFFELEYDLPEVDDLLPLESHLFVSSLTLSVIDKQGQVTTLDEEDVNTLLSPRNHPDLVLVGSHKGLAMYRLKDGEWRLEQNVDSFGNQIYSLAESEEGAVFGSLGRDNVARIILDDGPPRIELIPIPVPMEGVWSSIMNVEGDLYLNTVPCHKWDHASESFIPSPEMIYYVGEFPYGFNHVYGRTSDAAYVGIHSNHGSSVPRPKFQIVKHIASMNEGRETRAASIFYDESGAAFAGGIFGLILATDPLQESPALRKSPRIHRLLSLNDGYDLPTTARESEVLRLDSDQNSLRIEAEFPFFNASHLNEYQIHIEGLDNQPPEFQSIPFREITNIPAGSYIITVRALNSAGQIASYTLPIHIDTPMHRTPMAMMLYFVLAAAIIALISYGHNRSQIRKRRELEALVAERTVKVESQNMMLTQQSKRLEQQNSELEQKTEELTNTTHTLSNTLKQLQEMQDKLVETARTAGKAEIAINVLHNVGNLLNSINVSINILNTKANESKSAKLAKLARLLEDQGENINRFLTEDPKGTKIPKYLIHLSTVLEEEIESFKSELEIMGTGIDHVKNIVAAQQTHAKSENLTEPINLKELCDTAFNIICGDFSLVEIHLSNEIQDDVILENDRYSLLDIVLNLIANAKDAILEQNPEKGIITIRSKPVPEDLIQITISDNGSGIAGENDSKLFQHGFTTKANGHGFGLHGSANAAKSLGGSLSISSPGKGKGATATLTISRSRKEALLTN